MGSFQEQFVFGEEGGEGGRISHRHKDKSYTYTLSNFAFAKVPKSVLLGICKKVSQTIRGITLSLVYVGTTFMNGKKPLTPSSST